MFTPDTWANDPIFSEHIFSDGFVQPPTRVVEYGSPIGDFKRERVWKPRKVSKTYSVRWCTPIINQHGARAYILPRWTWLALRARSVSNLASLQPNGFQSEFSFRGVEGPHESRSVSVHDFSPDMGSPQTLWGRFPIRRATLRNHQVGQVGTGARVQKSKKSIYLLQMSSHFGPVVPQKHVKIFKTP